MLAQTTGFMKKILITDEDRNEDEIPLILLDAIAKLSNIYTPVSIPGNCDEMITTLDIYNMVYKIFPSDEYTADTISDLLIKEGWDFYYNPVLEEYFWQVKKTSTNI